MHQLETSHEAVHESEPQTANYCSGRMTEGHGADSQRNANDGGHEVQHEQQASLRCLPVCEADAVQVLSGAIAIPDVDVLILQDFCRCAATDEP